VYHDTATDEPFVQLPASMGFLPGDDDQLRPGTGLAPSVARMARRGKAMPGFRRSRLVVAVAGVAGVAA